MNRNGLSEKEVLKIRKTSGPNILPQKDGVSSLSIFSNQFRSPLIYILIVVALLSLAFAEYANCILIAVVITLNALMGFFQEYNAQKTLAALRMILKPRTFAIRDGVQKEIDVKDLVPGDLVVLEAGDRVPADGIFLEGAGLLANEAILTGEEEAIQKATQSDLNRLFMGSVILAGRGVMQVEKTGLETEMGKIGQSLAEIKREKTPLQVKLESFSRNLAIVVLGISFLIFLLGVIDNQAPLAMLKLAAVLAVAAIPESLPIVVTVILALGMRRILKRNGLVRQLLSIETLGSTSVICTDKTGTLTEGQMKVVRTDFKDEKTALLGLTVTNNQRSNLEIAIWEYVKAKGKFNPREFFDLVTRVYEEPFDSEKKYTLSVVKIGKKQQAFITGAPEIILEFCTITKKEKEKIIGELEVWAKEGLRVLGLVKKERGDLKEKEKYSYLGLVGIRDPIRAGVKEAIALTKSAGIDVKIITGDYRKTAERAAIDIGLEFAPENVMEGYELEKIPDAELKDRIPEIVLFSRVSPHQKMKIIKALQERGEIVAMTGDGVNDAPALKKADIGVAVGSASDVAKEAGDLVLMDNNFKTIVAACEEGRLIFSNIKKVVAYLLSNSFTEMILIFSAIILNLPSPLTIVQILWIQIICDGPPDIMLGFEPKEKDIMKQTPKEIKKDDILSGYVLFLIVGISLAGGLLSLLYFWRAITAGGDLAVARTVVFAAVASISLVYIFAFKNMKKIIFRTENFFKNKMLLLGVAYGFILILMAVYVPFFNKLLGTVPLKPVYWLFVLGVGLFATFIAEAAKIVRNKLNIKNGKSG